MSGTNKAPNTFTVGGFTYSMSKMNAFEQFHVLRKLGPLVARIGPAFLSAPPPAVNMATGEAEGQKSLVADLLAMDVLAPALEALSSMSEADCNYILHRCLAVTKRHIPPSGWVPVFNEAAQQLQFEDLDFPTMIQITIRVLGDNLALFTQGGAPSTDAPPTLSKGQ